MKSSSLLGLMLSVSVSSASLGARADDDVSAVSVTADGAGAATVTYGALAMPDSHVRLTGSTPGLALERRTGVTLGSGVVTEELWQPVCFAPCDATLRADARYRVYAPDTDPQPVPHLHGRDADLDADLHGGHTGASLTLVLLGMGAIGVGSALLISEAMSSSEASMMPAAQRPSVSYMPGIVVLSLSLPLLIAGAIVASSGQSALSVTMHESTPSVAIGGGVSVTPAGLAF